MLSPNALYPVLEAVLQAGQLIGHAPARRSVARHLASLLAAQDLRPSARVRILPAPAARAARHRFRWVGRALLQSRLASAALTPMLLRAGLALIRACGYQPAPGEPWRLAVDSVRNGPWEVFTVGLVLPGRVLPVAWAMLPYPWPKGQFRPAVDALLARLLRSWPAGEPVMVVADRAFPAKSFFRTLARGGCEWTARLQGRHHVTMTDGQCCQVAALLATADPAGITTHAVTFGAGADAVQGVLVIAGRDLLVVPAHQRGPGSFAARAKRQARKQQQLTTKYAGRRGTSHDEWLVLFTTETDPVVALRHYSMRWPIEGTYRDAQGGWDGQHGWNYDAVVMPRASAAEVDALTGLWALGTLVQTWLGLGLATPDAPPAVRAMLLSWSTTGRLSWWLRGRFALESPEPVMHHWVLTRIGAAQDPLLAAPPGIIPFVLPPPQTTATQQAA